MDDYFATIKCIVNTLALTRKPIKLNDFVGIVVTKSQNGFHFSQAKYMADILAKSDMASCNAMPTPMSIGHYLTKDLGGIIDNASQYLSITGVLQ